MSFICEHCNKQYTRKASLNRHKRTKHKELPKINEKVLEEATSAPKTKKTRRKTNRKVLIVEKDVNPTKEVRKSTKNKRKTVVVKILKQMNQLKLEELVDLHKYLIKYSETRAK